MAPPKPYFLLSEFATQDKVYKLLGRAVPFDSESPNDDNNPLKRPTEGHIYPELPPKGPDLRQLDKYLYPQEVTAKQASTLLASAHSSETKVAINKAISFLRSTETSNERTASIPVFRRFTIDEAPRRIKELLKHPEYSRDIFEYFTKFPNGKLGIINSIICVGNMSLNDQHNQSSETSAQVEVPSEAFGAPHKTADIKTKLSTSKNKISETEGTYEGEVVMACSYLQITRIRESRPWYMALFKPKKPSLHDIIITNENESIQPSTMTVALPGRRVSGNQEVILGAIVSTSDKAVKAIDDSSDSESDDDDGEIELYA
ncbi:uncharacterized protein F4822DRAFT_412552 [Hypoxylon trugodes]|uniref:uncharacterized protein n=1 Tax=Hypoxylon trugodes TaxID=326681 RepID=UPI00219509AA|nr:uncharacterized protein F4822DRAFT_412552 [Hypoxylon trugodes]KAI1385260.1 hypothetical protein F4822DRAFT_412552 [Hypoxylon trugodes]